MAKIWFWRLAIGALITIGAAAVYLKRPHDAQLTIQRIMVADGTNGVCAVDKDGFWLHTKIAVYDQEGHFVAQGGSKGPYECVLIPGMKAGEYWVALSQK